MSLIFFLFFFCYHTSHLYYVRIDGVAIIIIILLYGEARSRKYLVPGSVFFILPPYAEKPSEYCDLPMPTAGIEPGPPAQQATALSITPLHIGQISLIDLRTSTWQQQQLGLGRKPEQRVPGSETPKPEVHLQAVRPESD